MGSPGVHAPLRAVSRGGLVHLAAVDSGHARTGAQVRGHLHQWSHCERRCQSERLACGQADRTTAPATATVAYVGFRNHRGPCQEGILMDFALTEEQQLIVKTTREFVESELYPYEQEVEAAGDLDEGLRNQLRAN